MSDQPGSTSSMLLRMLGLEEIWQTANSPGFQAQITQMVTAILETRLTVARLEEKLDRLLGDQLEHDFTVARLSFERSGNGAGASTPTGIVIDAGGGGAPAGARASSGPPRGNGAEPPAPRPQPIGDYLG